MKPLSKEDKKAMLELADEHFPISDKITNEQSLGRVAMQIGWRSGREYGSNQSKLSGSIGKLKEMKRILSQHSMDEDTFHDAYIAIMQETYDASLIDDSFAFDHSLCIQIINEILVSIGDSEETKSTENK